MTETDGSRPEAPQPTSEGLPAGFFRAGPLVMVAIAAVIVAVDQVTKVLAVAGLEGGQPIRIVGDTVRLVLLRNPGAAFSLGTGSTAVLSVLATVVVLGLLWFSRRVHSRWWAWGLGLILGGAAGNLVDRFVRSPGVLRGHVVDFVSVGWWPVFNVADSCLVAGVIVVAVAVFRGMNPDGTREGDTDSRQGHTDSRQGAADSGQSAADSREDRADG